MGTIGNRIRCARESLGITQEQLGKLCGTTKQTIFKYENDIVTNIPMDRIETIAHHLRISPAYLMGWSDTPTLTPSNTTPTTDLSGTELTLFKDFRALNVEGQQKLLEYAADLHASGRYIKTASVNSLPKQA